MGKMIQVNFIHAIPRMKNEQQWGFWDYFVTALIVTACIPFILGNIVLLYYRHYRPIKTKSVYLTVLSSVGGLIWVAATIVVNNPERKNGSIWGFCTLWTFWLQACFGFSLWLNCLNVRLIVLYTIFNLKMRTKSVKSNLVKLVGLLLPTIILCICASVKQPIKLFSGENQPDPPEGHHPHEAKGNCRFIHGSWSIALLSLLVLYFLIFLVLSFMLRRAMAQYNEFRLIRNGGVMSLFLFLLSLVTMQTHAYKLVIGRSFLSLSVASAVFYYFWARNGEVIYNVIFNKVEYQRKFNDEMNRCPSERDSRENFPPSFQNLESDLKKARESITCYENQIKMLEEEIRTMEDKISDLQDQVPQVNSNSTVMKLAERSKSLVNLNGKVIKLSERSNSLLGRLPTDG